MHHAPTTLPTIYRMHLAALACCASLTGCPMEGTTPPRSGYQEFYTCVARVSELPEYIALSQRPGAPYTEAQVRAYYAQFPIGNVDTDGSPCYAQYWRIPDAVLVAAVDGYEGGLSLAFPLAKEGQPVPQEGIDGLGTADVVVHTAPGRVSGRYLLTGKFVNEDGTVRYDAATDIRVRDEVLGVVLIIQKTCPDVGGRSVVGIPVERDEEFDFSGEIACSAPEVFSSLQGLKMSTNIDDRISVYYYIWPENIARMREINSAVKDRIRSFLVSPKALRPITLSDKEV